MAKRKKREEREEKVYATVTLRSRIDESLSMKQKRRLRDTLESLPLPEAFSDATSEFEKMGFRVVSRGIFSLTISSSKEHFEEMFRARLKKKRVSVVRGRKKPIAIYYVSKERIKVPRHMSDLVEKITLPLPVQLCESFTAPITGYHSLHVPEEVSFLIRASSAHAHGWTGAGVHVAIVDSGFYNHAYYQTKGYNVTTVSVDPQWDSTADRFGHGTAIAANLLAVAPDVSLTMVKICEDTQWLMRQGIEQAVNLRPDVISCSWTGIEIMGQIIVDIEVERAIRIAVNQLDIPVVFACGNEGPVGWPGDMKEVVSVGGAYVDETFANWQASNYASSGPSPRYQGRIVPDVCGIVGKAPKGILIVEPTEPNSAEDRRFGGGTFPEQDETKTNDGWIVASGTSSAAPMVAGVVALILQKNPNHSPKTIKAILTATARDISTGTSASGEVATAGFDNATGYGLVDAKEALEGCFIATAAYGSNLAPEVQFLRSIRNAWIERSGTGKSLVDRAEQIYYKRSPKLALAMRCDPRLKKALRWTVVMPTVMGLRLCVAAANMRASLRKRMQSVRGEH